MRVAVLMSTYQGERFVGEQLASILAQLPPEGRIVVRDDGSTDGTVARIEAIGDARVQVLRGANVGFVGSFFSLLDQAPADAQMVMLSDQDDVWLPGKIERAWEAMRDGGEEPTLYCSRLELVDSSLNAVGHSPLWPKAPSFENALAENIVTGCTVALNPAAVALVKQRPAAGIHFHDWWMYLTVAAFGRVVFDPVPTIRYRQHGSNAIGMGAGPGRYLTIIRFLRRYNWVHIMFDQATAFAKLHGARLEPAQRESIERYFDASRPSSVLRLLLTPRRFRQRWPDEILLRGLVLMSVISGKGLRSPGLVDQVTAGRSGA